MKHVLFLAVLLVLLAAVFALGQQVVVKYTLDFQFADSEVPAGILNGSNLVFSLVHPPTPALSLILTRNGVVMRQGLDYTVNGTTVTFILGQVPQSEDVLLAWYRY